MSGFYDDGLVHGRCPGCRVVYRWALEAPHRLRVKDAVCGDCGLGLRRTGGASTRGPDVQDVDAEWLRPSSSEPALP